MARKYWLMKSEQDAYSFDDLMAEPEQTACWDGIRNYQARNFMMEMKVGDVVLFYHSNAKPPHVAGTARVARESYPDHTQFDGKSKYYDPKAPADAPRWQMVDLQAIEKLPRPVSAQRTEGKSQAGRYARHPERTTPERSARDQKGIRRGSAHGEEITIRRSQLQRL